MHSLSESFEHARSLAVRIGELPQSLLAPVRLLLSDARNGSISEGSKNSLYWLLKTPTLSTPIYNVAERFGVSERGTSALLSALSAEDLAAVILSLLWYRRMSTSLPNTSTEITSPLLINCELALHLGRAMELLGISTCLLSAVAMHFPPAVFQYADPKEFSKYQRHLKKSALQYDVDYEAGVWGCTRFDVAAAMFQMGGIGAERAIEMATAFADKRPLDSLPENLYRLRIFELWSSSLLTSRSAPNIAHREGFQPRTEALQELGRRVLELQTRGPEASYLHTFSIEPVMTTKPQEPEH